MAVVTHIGDIFQVRLLFVAPDQSRSMNVLHYKLKDVSIPGGGLWAGAPTYDVAPKLAEAIYDTFNVEWSPFGSNQVNFRYATAQNISPLPKSKEFTHDGGAGVFGEVVSEALPLQDAVTVLKYGAAAGRQNMGRVYVTGFSELAQVAGIITEDTVGLMEGFINRLGEIQPVILDGNTLNFWPVLFASDPGPPLVTRETEIIETQLSDRIMKTMRSRRPGKGS